MTKEALRKEIEEALMFLREAGYPVEKTQDIHDGYVSLYEAVLEILNGSGIEYDKETAEEILKEVIYDKNHCISFNTQ